MSDLIERKPLYERAARLEAEALDYASKLTERGSNGEATREEWRIWSAVLAERTAFKHDVFDAPSAEPEPLTDKEQRIFLSAMERERKVCRQVDEEWRNIREPYEDSLVHVCNEIERKVKGALWT